MGDLKKLWGHFIYNLDVLAQRFGISIPNSSSDIELSCLSSPFDNPQEPDSISPIRMAVLLNDDSKQPEVGEIYSALFAASELLKQVAGRTFSLTDFCRGRFGKYNREDPASVLPSNIVRSYLEKTDHPADYVVVLSTDHASTPAGGQKLGPFPADWLRHHSFCQTASYEATEPVVYAAVVQPVKPLGGCGYEEGPDGEYQKTGDTSKGGACRGQEGLRCVEKGEIQLCPGDENHVKASTAGLLAHKIVHELGHNFHGLFESMRNVHCNNELAICPEIWDRLRDAGLKCFSR